MVKPKDIWMAWAEDLSGIGEVKFLGTVPCDTKPEDLDVEEFRDLEKFSNVRQRYVSDGIWEKELRWTFVTGYQQQPINLDIFVEDTNFIEFIYKCDCGHKVFDTYSKYDRNGNKKSITTRNIICKHCNKDNVVPCLSGFKN